MDIRVKRAYDDPADNDGYRVLVDRLWPRGRSKEKLRLDDWLKEISPSDELRRWYHRQEGGWEEFCRRYYDELENKDDELEPLLARLRDGGRVTLVYSAKDEEKNNAVALRNYLRKRLGKD